MARLVLVVVLGVSVCLAIGSGQAWGQTPDRLESYTFLPNFSLLRQTGGFAGTLAESPIWGGFDLLTGEISDEGPFASFEKVDAYWRHPLVMAPIDRIDLDQTLNLSGLKGVPVSVPEPFAGYYFTGEDGQGAPIHLGVVVLGPWLYMEGGTVGFPCCDYFNYEVHALTHRDGFADFDLSSTVDAEDLEQWRWAVGLNAAGDANADQDSDISDLMVWQRQVGVQPPGVDFSAVLAPFLSGAAAGSSSLTVPEPSAFVLVLMGLAVFVSQTRRGG